MASVDPVHFDGPCPFLSCVRQHPHDHPVCPDCGAVRYGNLDCSTCRAQFRPPVEEDDYIEEQRRWLDEDTALGMGLERDGS